MKKCICLLVLLFAFSARISLYAEDKAIGQLVRWETEANPMDQRSAASFKLENYEIPLELVGTDFATYLSPQILESLIFEREGKKYVRWIINPEDTKYFKQIEKFLKGKDIPTTRYQYFTARKTASASLIVESPVGAVFSVKASTNKTGGKWKKKELRTIHAKKARQTSDYLHALEAGLTDKTVLQYDAAALTLPEIDKAVIIRDLGPLGEKGNYFIPGFTLVHETEGKKIAKANGYKDPAEFVGLVVPRILGEAQAMLLAETGAWLVAPHGQNILFELDANKKLTGRVVFRNLQDMHFFKPVLDALPALAAILGLVPDGRMEEKAKVGTGLFHEIKRPSWFSKLNKQAMDKEFFAAFTSTYSELTGIPKNAIQKISTNYSDKYYSVKVLTRNLFNKSPPENIEHRNVKSKSMAEVSALSDRLRKVSQILEKKFGIGKIYLGGGSARAILDHVYLGKALSMRDIDTFVLADRNVDRSFSEKVAKELEKNGLGSLDLKELNPKHRGDSHSKQIREVGYGFFLNSPGDYLDICLFHDQESIDLNGIFDSDTILLPLDGKNGLSELVSRLRKSTYEQMKKDGTVIDPHDGYSSWRQGKLRIIHWGEVARDPSAMALRLVRAYHKAGYPKMPQKELAQLRKLIKTNPETEIFVGMRNLVKVLGESEPLPILRMLASTGALDAYSPSLSKILSSPSFPGAKTELWSKGSTTNSLAQIRLENLLRQIPESELSALLLAVEYAAPELHKIFITERDAFAQLTTDRCALKKVGKAP